jgi:hypothetical protein
MAQRILIALGAGLAAGVLFVLPSKGMMAGVWLSVLAPMPLMIACMGYGLLAGIGAAVVGAIASAVMQPALGLIFLVSTAFPAILLAWLASHPCAGERRLGPGHLLTVVTALALLAVWSMLAFVGLSYGGLDEAATEVAAGVLELMKRMKGMEDAASGMALEDFVRVLVASMPAIMTFWSVLALSLNLWLAARVALISGLLAPPWPDLPTHLALPRAALGAFALATLACALPGASRVIASCAAAGLGVAFALQGLAALHRLSRGRASRSGLLSALYALVFFLFPLPLFILAGVGVADNVKPLWRSLPKPSSTNP